MSKYTERLMKKYGSTRKKSRFEEADEMMAERAAFNEKLRLRDERRKQNLENLQKMMRDHSNIKDSDLDEHWLEVDLGDGRTIFYKDGKQYDADTGEQVFIL